MCANDQCEVIADFEQKGRFVNLVALTRSADVKPLKQQLQESLKAQQADDVPTPDDSDLPF